MNVIVMIDGREAIPVRAIPFLTNWETMSPDAIAEALAHEDDLHWDYFFPLTAFRVEGPQLKPIAASWWENFPVKHLSAISAALKARETAGELTHELAYIEWRRQSLLELPSGVFVWKDEFAPCHSRKYNSYAMTTIRNGKELSKDEQEKRYALDFDPYIADLETCAAVMQGFESLLSNIAAENTNLAGVVNKSSVETHPSAATQERPESTKPEGHKAPAGTQPELTQWEMMASSDQLCAAFGSFTGMDSTWFNNLNDVPKLKAARHMPGQGGRAPRKPLFYVYPVFEWLLDTKRRKGRSVSPRTGWRLLKSHFPTVYAKHEFLDPSQD